MWFSLSFSPANEEQPKPLTLLPSPQLGRSHFVRCVTDVTTVHCSGQGSTELSLHEPYREPTNVRVLSILVKHKQTSQEAVLRASPTQRAALGNSVRLQNKAYSKEGIPLLACSGVSILSLMAQYQTDTAKHKNKQRGFCVYQHLSCLFRAKMLKIPRLLPVHAIRSHESYCISPAFIWLCFWSHLTEEAE